MSLHPPVHALDLQVKQFRSLASYGLLAPFHLLWWATWRPQRLRAYEAEWIRTAQRSPMPAGPSWRKWQEWANRNPYHGDLIFICGGALLIVTIVNSFILWAIVQVAVSTPGLEPHVSLVFGIVTGALFGWATQFAYLFFGAGSALGKKTAIGTTFLVGWFFSILGAAVAIVTAEATSPGAVVQLIAPVIYGFAVALAFGIWLSIGLAFTESKLQSKQLLVLFSIAVGIACSGLLMGLYFLPQNAWNQFSQVQIALGLSLATLLSSIGFAFGVVRVDNWLYFIMMGGKSRGKSDWEHATIPAIAFVTPLPVQWLENLLDAWLDTDLERGCGNAWALWEHTRQQPLVSRAVRQRLARQQSVDDLMQAADTLVNERLEARGRILPSDWSMFLGFEPHRPASNGKMLDEFASQFGHLFHRKSSTKSTAGNSQPQLPTPLQKRQKERQKGWELAAQAPYPAPVLPTKKPLDAVTACYWYLYNCYIEPALAAVKSIPSPGPKTKEMLSVVTTLDRLWQIENVVQVAAIDLPPAPRAASRPGTWAVLHCFVDLGQLGWLFLHTTDAGRRRWCLEEARAMLLAISQMTPRNPRLVRLSALPASAHTQTVETRVIRRLALEWSDNLLQWEAESSSQNSRRRIDSPFVVARPITAQSRTLFVGREPELAQLAVYWSPAAPQNVVIYGQPLIGKTSLINMAAQAASRKRVVPVLFEHESASLPPVSQLLLAVLNALRLDYDSLTSTRDEAEWFSDPYRLFSNHLRQTYSEAGQQTTTIVIEGIDSLELAYPHPNSLVDGINFLVHLHEHFAGLTFTFVTRLPPKYWRRNPNHPFVRHCGFLPLTYFKAFSSSTHIHDQFEELTHQFVNVPLRPSGIRLDSQALQRVFTHSCGHPYLMAALAHALVIQFNSRPGNDPVLTAQDIDEAIQQLAFRIDAELYYQSVTDTVRQIAGRGKGEMSTNLLRVIAHGASTRINLAILSSKVCTTTIGSPTQDEFSYIVDSMIELGLATAETAGTDRFIICQPKLYWEWAKSL